MFYGIIHEGFIRDYIEKRKREKKELEEYNKKQSEIAKQKQKEKEENENIKKIIDNMSSEEKSEFKKLFDKTVSDLVKMVKVEGNALLKDPKFRKHVRGLLDKAYKEDVLNTKYDKEYYNNDKIPKIDAKDIGGGISVINEDQIVNCVCGVIVDKVAKIIQKKTGFAIDTGDGDEGCIYPDVMQNKAIFYKKVYKKQNK
jgi:hypothetical protein